MAGKRTRRLVLIDGHSLLHRAYHAFPKNLTTSSGQLINTVYGFTRMFLAVVKELQPSYLVVAFDRPEPTFRHKQFADYKIQRPATPKELVEQIDQVKEVIKVFGVPILEKKGFEADDIIGTLAKRACLKLKVKSSKSKVEVVIVTGDRDMLQLVSGNQVKVYFPKQHYSNAQFFNEREVKKKYRLTPEQLIDLKALTGDPSDNIPGVPGIGPKTSIELLQNWGSLERIYENLKKIPEKVAVKLKKKKKVAFLSRELAKIETGVAVKLDLRTSRFGNYDEEEVIALFQRLEFKSLLNQLPNSNGEQMRLV